MRMACNESPNSVCTPAAAMSGGGSPPQDYCSSLQAATSIPSSIGDVYHKSNVSPFRGCGFADAASLWDETRSVSSSVRSTRRRRGGDVDGAGAGEGKSWTQAFMDLEQMRKENQEYLQGSLRGDRSENGSLLDEALAGSRSVPSAISSVLRRRRVLAAGASASGREMASSALFEKSLSGTPVVAESVLDTAEAQTSAAALTSAEKANNRHHGNTSDTTDERLASPQPSATYSPADVDTESHPAVPEPGRTSALPRWLKRPTVEEGHISMANSLSKYGAAAPTAKTEAVKKAEGPLCTLASSTACSPIVDAPAEKLNEAALVPSPATTQSARMSLSTHHFTPATRMAHTDPVGIGAPSPSRGSRSRMNATTSSAAVPTSNASVAPPMAAGDTLARRAATAYPTRRASPLPSTASQPLAQTYLTRQTNATEVGAAPSSSLGGNARFPHTSVKATGSPVLNPSPAPFAPPTVAGVVDTACKTLAEAPAGVASAAKPAEERPLASAPCVSGRAAFENKSKSPDPQQQLTLAVFETDRPTTTGSLRAPALNRTATVAEKSSLGNALATPNVSASLKRTIVRDRAASAMRTAHDVGRSNTFSRFSAEQEALNGEKCRFPPRAAASVPKQRRCSLVARVSQERAVLETSQPKVGPAPRSSAVSLLNRTTVLTELRRQEVLRDRLARERKTAEEASSRFTVVKQPETSRANVPGAHTVEGTSSVRAVTGSVEARSSSSQDTMQHFLTSRRVSSAVQLRTSHKRVGLVSPPLTTPAVSATYLRLCTENPSHLGKQQFNEVVGAASSKMQRVNTSVTSVLPASTPKVDRGHSVRGENPQGGSSLEGAETFAHLRRRVEDTVLSGTQLHLQSAAFRKDSAAAMNPSNRGSTTKRGERRAEHWANTTSARPQPAATVVEKSSSAAAKKAAPKPGTTASSEPIAPTTGSLTRSAPSRTAPSSRTTGQPCPLPFCVECGYRHMDDFAKFCAVCGQKRAYIS
ncbi:hypothetical protein, conserved [Leishmania tarentolae]|uniref:Uncharacterized protein n=1 Tax=Leishmania tarentolae TaxID=5689 RepID=A0A640KVX9_LEITA|nr:hypothetical protein, conserved [Leishmania tarentolae]